MRLRATHLACVMLLLSTFGAADAHALAQAPYARRGQHVGILIQQAAASSDNPFPHTAAQALRPALPGAPVAHTWPVWTMRPPAAHTVAQHAATGSGL